MWLFEFTQWYNYNHVKYLWTSYLPELIHLISNSEMLRYANQQKMKTIPYTLFHKLEELWD